MLAGCLYKVTLLTLCTVVRTRARSGRAERRLWTPRLAPFGGRRARTGFYYDAFIPDPIAELDLTVAGDIAEVVSDATVAVRDLQGSPRLGALEALARQLLRAEAVASSRIEGLEMSHRRLARAAFAPDEADASAREVVGNVRAMEAAIARGADPRPLATADLRAIHERLFRGTRDDHRAGQIRTEQNWIGGGHDSPRNAEFIPPAPERLPALLRDLVAFLRRDDLPAIAQAAIAHAQFETIHPFADGNGRVGRCLIHVVLRRRGLALTYVPPISLVLATDQAAYIRGLTVYRSYAPEPVASWVATFAQATRTAAREALGFAEQIAHLQDRWRERARIRRRGSAADLILSLLPAQPVIDIRTAAEHAGVVYEAARLAAEQLQGAGILRPISSRRRDRLFEAPEVFALVDGFERHLATPEERSRQERARPARRVPRAR